MLKLYGKALAGATVLPVARKLPGNADFSNSSGPAGVAKPHNPWDRFGQNVEQAVNRVNAAVAADISDARLVRLDTRASLVA